MPRRRHRSRSDRTGRLREEADRIEVVPGAVERHRVIRHAAAQQIEDLVHAPASGLEGLTERVVLALAPPDPGPDDQAPATHRVDAREVVGQPHRMCWPSRR